MNFLNSYLTGGIVVVFLALAVIAGYIVAVVFIGRAAGRKNRSVAAFVWLTLLLSPLITALVVAAIPFELDDPRSPRNKRARLLALQQQGYPQDTVEVSV
jgi:hypothetical protein